MGRWEEGHLQASNQNSDLVTASYDSAIQHIIILAGHHEVWHREEEGAAYCGQHKKFTSRHHLALPETTCLHMSNQNSQPLTTTSSSSSTSHHLEVHHDEGPREEGQPHPQKLTSSRYAVNVKMMYHLRDKISGTAQNWSKLIWSAASTDNGSSNRSSVWRRTSCCVHSKGYEKNENSSKFGPLYISSSRHRVT